MDRDRTAQMKKAGHVPHWSQRTKKHAGEERDNAFCVDWYRRDSRLNTSRLVQERQQAQHE